MIAGMSEFVLEEFLPYRLSVLAEQVSRDFARSYRDRFGISVAEWRVIAHLGRGGEVSVRDIHDRVAMDKSKVSRAATRLEAEGLISKRTDPNDRRLLKLSLTPNGRALLDELTPLARDFQAHLTRRLGPRAGDFLDALDSLTETS